MNADKTHALVCSINRCRDWDEGWGKCHEINVATIRPLALLPASISVTNNVTNSVDVEQDFLHQCVMANHIIANYVVGQCKE